MAFAVLCWRAKWGPGASCVLDVSKRAQYIEKSRRTIIECDKSFELLFSTTSFHVLRVGNDIRQPDTLDLIQRLKVDIARRVPVCIFQTLHEVCTVRVAHKKRTHCTRITQHNINRERVSRTLDDGVRVLAEVRVRGMW